MNSVLPPLLGIGPRGSALPPLPNKGNTIFTLRTGLGLGGDPCWQSAGRQERETCYDL
jgi:hypothetical protein